MDINKLGNRIKIILSIVIHIVLAYILSVTWSWLFNHNMTFFEAIGVITFILYSIIVTKNIPIE